MVHVSDGFLQQRAKHCKINYQLAGRAVGKFLAIVNDHAEVRVALVQSYSGHLTEQQQFFLQVVAHHRK